MSSSDIALAGLLQTTLFHFDSLKPYLPSFDEATNDAVQWAVSLARAGLEFRDVLGQREQRVSVFTYLFQEQTPIAEKRHIPLHELELKPQIVFPEGKEDDPEAAYRGLIRTLEQGLKALTTQPGSEAKLLHVYDLLQRTTWCLPSPYFQNEEPDVSLFDFARVVAALAPCYSEDQREDISVARLISGDISGVQDFIYTITARGATSGLRGRSFYLQLLTEAIARYVLDALELPPTSLIYAGGGHFYLIAPYRLKQDLSTIQRQISLNLLTHHQGRLYLALGQSELAAVDFHPHRFSERWREMVRSLRRSKVRHFQELGEELYDRVFLPYTSGGGKEDECQVCHEERPTIADEQRLDDEGDPLRKCYLCASLEELGKQLRSARYLLWYRPGETESDEGTWQAALADFGVAAQPYEKLEDIPRDGEGGLVWAFGDEAFRDAHMKKDPLPYPLRLHYVVNVTPQVRTKEDQEILAELLPDETVTLHGVKPFGLIEEQAHGIKRLGMLRMDVDDLGLIFATGFGRQGSTLVRTAGLSFALSLFFEGWVARLAEAVGGERDVIYSIYSGGDDLFVVGAWDVLPDLAARIASDLQQYAAGNPHIHASAGITLHGSKYPLYQAADTTKKALEKAKSYHQNGQSKNALTFLDRTFSWLTFPAVQTEFEKLCQLDAQGVPRSLIRRLVQLDALYQQHKNEQHLVNNIQAVYWGPWHWLSAYHLSRLAERHKDQARAILELRDSLALERFHHIEQLGMAARWAELYLRQRTRSRKE